jgi:hypothetical protein
METAEYEDRLAALLCGWLDRRRPGELVSTSWLLAKLDELEAAEVARAPSRVKGNAIYARALADVRDALRG